VVHQLSPAEARRIAVRAQLLDSPRPTDLLGVIRRLAMLQDDPVKAVAPSAELVVWSRLGHTDGLAEAREDGTLIDLRGFLRPREDIALYRAEMAAWPGKREGWRAEVEDWVEANRGCHGDILELLRADGPLTSAALPDSCVVSWRSSGWNGNRNVRMLLDLMVQRGEVAAAGWEGRDRLWDLAERVYPDDPVVPLDEARRVRDERRLQSLGIARARVTQSSIEPDHVGEIGEEAVVEGVKGTWRVDPAQLGQPFTGRTVLLSPIDRLVYDRKRMTEIFGFDYQLEMFKPAAKRKWGYWAMPVLHGDQLVGKLDATADRDDRVLRVNAIHEDGRWTKAIRSGVQGELEDLASWLGFRLAR
jgi:uncharacterized protein YcaQ